MSHVPVPSLPGPREERPAAPEIVVSWVCFRRELRELGVEPEVGQELGAVSGSEAAGTVGALPELLYPAELPHLFRMLRSRAIRPEQRLIPNISS